MDKATIVGIIGGLLVILAAILVGGSPVLFINIPSILIVVLGSLFVVAVKFSIPQLKEAFKVAGKAFSFKLDEPHDITNQVIDLAKKIRKDGPLAVEGAKIDYKFLDRGIQLLVDNAEPDTIKNILEAEQNSTSSRHETGQKIFMALNDVAPAMGMIGTLIGLVQMLANMDDPKSIGPAMAVALLTTLYGAIIANVVAKPIADKLEIRGAQEEFLQTLVIDAVVGLAKGTSPTMVQENLVSYLNKNQKKFLGDDEGGGEAQKAA